jgi:hypothetical protein
MVIECKFNLPFHSIIRKKDLQQQKYLEFLRFLIVIIVEYTKCLKGFKCIVMI